MSNRYLVRILFFWLKLEVWVWSDYEFYDHFLLKRQHNRLLFKISIKDLIDTRLFLRKCYHSTTIAKHYYLVQCKFLLSEKLTILFMILINIFIHSVHLAMVRKMYDAHHLRSEVLSNWNKSEDSTYGRRSSCYSNSNKVNKWFFIRLDWLVINWFNWNNKG